MHKYVTQSLELHLFFSRIMKEHAIFLEAAFTPKDASWAKKADDFKNKFEQLLMNVTEISCRQVRPEVLNSEELVTPFTLKSEQMTQNYTGIMINSNITMKEQELINGRCMFFNNDINSAVRQINKEALNYVSELIEFKESILREVNTCKMFTANYPAIIDHLIEEARMYRSSIIALEENKELNNKDMHLFWDDIMMDHALFMRGLLDPDEESLISTSNNFANDYKNLIEETKKASDTMIDSISNKTLIETIKFRDFKEAGAEGINNCKIKSIIIPLLADHVLREANHYIRLLTDK